jgi:hypothetical protein
VDQDLPLPIHEADVHLTGVEIDGLTRARSVGLPAFTCGKILLASSQEARIRS